MNFLSHKTSANPLKPVFNFTSFYYYPFHSSRDTFYCELCTKLAPLLMVCMCILVVVEHKIKII